MNLLDTSIIIELIREKRYEHGAISVVTLIEVVRGVNEDKTNEIKELLEQSFNLLNLDNKVITTYCTLYHKLREKGETIPDADLLIAATAIANNLPLKTEDRHFTRMKNLGLQLTELEEHP